MLHIVNVCDDTHCSLYINPAHQCKDGPHRLINTHHSGLMSVNALQHRLQESSGPTHFSWQPLLLWLDYWHAM